MRRCCEVFRIVYSLLWILSIGVPTVCLSQQDTQQQKIDSLKLVISTSKSKIEKINALEAYDNIIYLSDPELDFKLNLQIDSIAKQLILTSKDPEVKKLAKQKRIFATRNLGIIYKAKGDLIGSRNAYEETLLLSQQIDDSEGMANAYNGIGNIYLAQGDYAQATENYSNSLTINEKINNKRGQANNLINLGTIHKNYQDYDKAIKLYKEALNIYDEINAKRGIAGALTNISNIHVLQKEYDKALNIANQTLTIQQSIDNKSGIAHSYSSIGEAHKLNQNYSEAVAAFTQSLEIRQQIGDVDGVSKSYTFLAETLYETNELYKAEEYALKAYSIADSIGSKINQGISLEALYIIYKRQGNANKALEYHEKFLEVKDFLESEKNKEALIKQEFKYFYDQKAIADSIRGVEAAKVKDAQLEAQRAKTEQQRIVKYFLYAGLGLALIAFIFILNRFKVTQHQKRIIEEQKEKVHIALDELELRNEEILSSITYAQRIQSAILPPNKTFKELLPKSFVLYKPKDIVAGDFYWLEKLEDTIFFAAADCTGHGVPGAMVSVICNSGLNRSVREYRIQDPGAILSKTRELVISEFEKSEEDVKDGMDIALCALRGKYLKYAGAHNPLWIVRDQEVIEIKADKQPVGVFHKYEDYTTHEVELQENDTLYIFSDGFIDQFGGPKGKKFKSKQLKELLISIQNLSMTKQKIKLDQIFETWKGSLEQIDDVCLIGIKI